jgi:hypothetical protein
VARTEDERQQAIRAIGPAWDGNEVWLLAAGGTLFFAFPLLYASSFSGFYMPLMIVLWLLILRGLAIELRSHFEDPLWRSFFDGLLLFASSLLAIFSAPPWPTSSAAFPSARTITSISRCGPTGGQVQIRASWIGTRSSVA